MAKVYRMIAPLIVTLAAAGCRGGCSGPTAGKNANENSSGYCGGSVAAIAGISTFQDGLSGLQQLQIVRQGLALGGIGNLLTTNGLANIGTGGSISYPVGPLALIANAIGAKAAPAPVNAFAASTPRMNIGRQQATATLLPNGKVLIAGGANRSRALSSTEIYDPATNTFAASTPSMNVAREFATAALLPNGKVLIAGGVNSSGVISSTEIYDPATNTFAASTPSMNDAHEFATATLLRNGKVLIAGGLSTISTTGNFTDLASTEIYSP